MNNYQIGCTVYVQVNTNEDGTKCCDFYEKGFIFDLDTQIEKSLPAEDARAVLEAVQTYHASQSIRDKQGEN